MINPNFLLELSLYSLTNGLGFPLSMGLVTFLQLLKCYYKITSLKPPIKYSYANILINYLKLLFTPPKFLKYPSFYNHQNTLSPKMTKMPLSSKNSLMKLKVIMKLLVIGNSLISKFLRVVILLTL